MQLKNQARNDLSPKEMAAVDALHTRALAAQAVDLDALQKQLPAAAQPAYAKTLSARQMPNRKVRIDGAFAKRAKRIRRFRGAGGLRVEVKTDSYQDIVHSVKRIRPALGQPYYRIILHTETWDELP